MTVNLDFVDDAQSADLAVLNNGLSTHALPITQVPGFNQTAVFARIDNSVVGGAVGLINWNWLYVSTLWVSPDQRNAGLGSRLLNELMQVGNRRGCIDVHLDTFTFQAPGFYEKLGFEQFARLDNYPDGHSRCFYRRKI